MTDQTYKSSVNNASQLALSCRPQKGLLWDSLHWHTTDGGLTFGSK